MAHQSTKSTPSTNKLPKSTKGSLFVATMFKVTTGAVVCVCGLLIIALLSSKSAFAANERRALFRLSRPSLTSSTTTTTTTTSTTTTTESPPQYAAPFAEAVEQIHNHNQSQSEDSRLGARNSRAASDIFKDGDGYNIFVTNTCELDSMKVNIKTSRPFYGVIHTKNQRQKPVCSVEGGGGTDYNLEISHVLNPADANYCGVIRAKRNSPQDKDILSVVVAVRFHPNIEISDDKFFLLNCTNRCRKPDCSKPSRGLAELINEPTDGRETEGIDADVRDRDRELLAPNSPSSRNSNGTSTENECTIWRLPWAVALLWCMAIIILSLLISHCILCSSLSCKWVKKEIEEREESVFEGTNDTDDDDDDDKDDNADVYNKKHPYRIDYDNKDIYKTSNNYSPYSLKDAQQQTQSKRR